MRQIVSCQLNYEKLSYNKNMNRKEIVGKNINLLRSEREMSQKQLAEVLSVTRGTISLWELGKRAPDLESICVLAKYFDVTTDFLLGAENY